MLNAYSCAPRRENNNNVSREITIIIWRICWNINGDNENNTSLYCRLSTTTRYNCRCARFNPFDRVSFSILFRVSKLGRKENIYRTSRSVRVICSDFRTFCRKITKTFENRNEISHGRNEKSECDNKCIWALETFRFYSFLPTTENIVKTERKFNIVPSNEYYESGT